MEELKKLLQAYIGGEDDFFRSLVMGSDPNTFAVNIDEVEETPAVGCLVSRRATADVVGKPCYEFSLFFVIKRLEDADEEEWDFAQRELITEMHCFLARIRSALWRYPQTFNHWSDHALSGYWCDLTASAVSVSECVSCLPPTPPDPRMGYYEYLEAYNGVDNYNIWLLTHITNFEGLRVTIRGYTTSTQAATVWFQRIGAFNRTDPANVPTNVVYDFSYDYVNNLMAFRNAETQILAHSASMSINYGSTRYNGFFALWYGRNTNNTSYGRIYSIKVERDGELICDMRPYVDKFGVTGLKDVVTGEFFTPQQNVSIVAVNKLDENGRSLPLGDAKVVVSKMETVTEEEYVEKKGLLKGGDSEEEQPYEDPDFEAEEGEL